MTSQELKYEALVLDLVFFSNKIIITSNQLHGHSIKLGRDKLDVVVENMQKNHHEVRPMIFKKKKKKKTNEYQSHCEQS